jgi:predicted RNA-binding protein associated with RNAse of E/G family
VEPPAVLELLAAMETGQITAAQARAAFAPFFDRLEEYDQADGSIRLQLRRLLSRVFWPDW